MEDQPQYTGATYNADIYKLPNETLPDYLARLAKLRAKGILGGGGMLDLKETPTVVTPAAQQPLGKLVVRADNDSDYTPPPDTRTPEEKMRDNIALQTGHKSDWGKVIAQGIPVLGGLLSDYAAGKRTDTLRDVLNEQAIDKDQIEEYLNNPDYKQELTRAYNMGQFTGGNIPADLLDVNEAGSALVYQAENLPDTLLKAIGIRDKVENPFMTKVIGNPTYGTFTNFLAQQTPMTRKPTASEMIDGMLMGNGMLSTQADSGDTVYTSSWGDTYDFGSYSPETQAGLSITDSYNDGSFGD